MTAQANEVIQYRGENLSFPQLPLYKYFESRKDIVFELYTTGHWRGYQGFWKLEKNNLFLINLESTNYTFHDIFKTEEPVLADWYSGYLNIGIGNYKSDGYNIYYENYLLLKLDKGIVISRKIVKQFSSDLEIHFGKYKGNYLSDVLKGKSSLSYNIEGMCKDYINEVFSFLQQSDYVQKINVPYFKIDESVKELVHDIRNTSITYLLTKNFLAIEKHFYINAEGEEETELFSKLIENILISDFGSILTLSKKNFEEQEISKKTLLINPDFQYINWAIKNVTFFSVPPHVIDKEIKLKVLTKFNVNRLNSTIIEYQPVIKEITFNFPLETKTINNEKFEEKFKVKFDRELNIYCVNLPQDELLEKFGIYLDEDYFPINEDDFQYDDDSYYDKPSYEKYNGAYGYDDDTIDSAFDGDPENYWNID